MKKRIGKALSLVLIACVFISCLVGTLIFNVKVDSGVKFNGIFY